jgi:general secretion pathway protein H
MKRGMVSPGFTLVEMLVVLALVALITAISLPYSVKSGAARQLDAAAEIVAAQLRTARSAAIAANDQRDLAFDLKARTISGPAGLRATTLPAEITLSVTTADNLVQDITAAITFFADGGSTGGTVTLGAQGEQRLVKINWLTGSIVIEAGKRDAAP